LPFEGVEFVLGMVVNLLLVGQNIIHVMRNRLLVLVRSLTRLDILQDMVHGLLDVARHLGLAGGFPIQAVEFVELKQVGQRKSRRTGT
jgi:hypothetical protein